MTHTEQMTPAQGALRWLGDIPGLPKPPLDCVLTDMASVLKKGMWLEFGVFQGGTLRAIADASTRLGRTQPVYGFDAFRGLPADWIHGNPKGMFDMDGKPPDDMPANVELVVGWFDATLPGFLDKHTDEPVALLHIDCDLYSSTKTVLEALASRLQPGCVIVFDELVGYDGFEKNECRALAELCARTGLAFQVLGGRGWSCAIYVLDNPCYSI